MLSRIKDSTDNFYEPYRSEETINRQLVRLRRSDVLHPSLFPTNLTPSPDVSEDESPSNSPPEPRTSKLKAKKKIKECLNVPQVDGNITNEILSDEEYHQPQSNLVITRILRRKSESLSHIEDLMTENLSRRLFSTTDPNLLENNL